MFNFLLPVFAGIFQGFISETKQSFLYSPLKTANVNLLWPVPSSEVESTTTCRYWPESQRLHSFPMILFFVWFRVELANERLFVRFVRNHRFPEEAAVWCMDKCGTQSLPREVRDHQPCLWKWKVLMGASWKCLRIAAASRWGLEDHHLVIHAEIFNAGFLGPHSSNNWCLLSPYIKSSIPRIHERLFCLLDYTPSNLKDCWNPLSALTASICSHMCSPPESMLLLTLKSSSRHSVASFSSQIALLLVWSGVWSLLPRVTKLFKAFKLRSATKFVCIF